MGARGGNPFSPGRNEGPGCCLLKTSAEILDAKYEVGSGEKPQLPFQKTIDILPGNGILLRTRRRRTTTTTTTERK